MTRLDSLLDTLLNQADRGGQLPLLGGRPHHLAGGLHEAVARAHENRTLDTLRACVDAVSGDEFPSSLSPPVAAVAADRVCERIRALVSSAIAAVWAVRLPLDGRDAWLGMTGAMADTQRWLTQAELVPVLPEPELWPVGAVGAVDAACRQWRERGQDPSWAREWVLSHLSADEPWRVRVPVAFALGAKRVLLPGGQTGQDGFLADLQMWRGRPNSTGLIEASSLALWPFDRSLLEAVQAQWRLSGGVPAVWTLVTAETTPDYCDLVRGDSLGGAVRVGFELLARHERPIFESDVLILAAVSDSDSSRLAPVDGIANKCAAADRSGRVRRVLLAQGTPAHARPTSATGRLEYLYADTVEEAVEHASGIVTELVSYFERLKSSALERGQRQTFLGDRTVSELHVDMDVQVMERRPLRQGPDGPGEAEGREGASRSRADQKRTSDFNEPVTPTHPGEVPRRIRWIDACREFLTSGRLAVLIGASGAGKSHLARMTIFEMASLALAQLREHRVTLDETVIPIGCECCQLAEAFRAATVEAEVGKLSAAALTEWVSSLVAPLGAPQGGPEPASAYVLELLRKSDVRGPRVLVVLDAFDQVGLNDQDAFIKGLRTLQQHACRVLITSRPLVLRSQPWRHEATAYDLAPFSDAQTASFLQNWFKDDEPRRRMRDLLRANPSLRDIAQAPLLLTLMCWASERHPLSSDLTRTQLYDMVVTDMLAFRRVSSGSGTVGSRVSEFAYDEPRGLRLRPFVGKIVFELFDELLRDGVLLVERILDVMKADLKEDGDGPDPLGPTGETLSNLPSGKQVQLLWKELADKGLFAEYVAQRVSGQRVLAAEPAHRSIAEHLAAVGLAGYLKKTPLPAVRATSTSAGRPRPSGRGRARKPGA